jgi:hypothetical protein
MLGMRRGGVNENGTTMDTATPKSQILRISVALAPVICKGSNSESPFGGLSPPVLEGRVAGQPI